MFIYVSFRFVSGFKVRALVSVNKAMFSLRKVLVSEIRVRKDLYVIWVDEMAMHRA